MKFIQSKNLTSTQKVQIVELWNNEYPKKLRHNSLKLFDSYLNNLKQQNHFLIIDNQNIVNGWLVSFIRDNEKWFAMVLNSEIQGKRFGTKLLDKAKLNEQELNGWVIDHNNDTKENGKFYQSPIKFYVKNNFKIIVKSRLELDIISAVKITWKK